MLKIKFAYLPLTIILFIWPFSIHAEENSSKESYAVDPMYQNERIMLGFVRRIYDIQAIYKRDYGNGDFGTPDQLYAAGLIDQLARTHYKYGYYFVWYRGGSSMIFPGDFSFRVTPRFYGRSGRRSFYIDSKCIVRWTDGQGYRYADEKSPILETCEPYIAIENEPNALPTMRLLATAQETYRATVGNGNYANSLNALYQAGLIEQSLGNGYANHYYFTGSAVPVSATRPPTFYFQSRPLIYRGSGLRSFYIDQTGVIRGADHEGGPSDQNDPPIDQINGK